MAAPSILPSVRLAVRHWGAVAIALVASACTSPQYPNCENDSHCQRDGHHEWCIDGHCQQCRTTSDCPADHRCLRNVCMEGANACENDGDCPGDQRCQGRQCVPRTECDANRPCPADHHCEAGRCVSDVESDTPPPENRGSQCTFDPPYFAFDDSRLDTAARATLERTAECLRREGTSRYTLIGRCDPRGTTEYNLALGERRARVAQRYLISLGILPERIAASSEGSEGATGTDEASWARDRRVDFRPRP